MSIPTDFATSEEYLTTCMQFLQKYEWLYNYNNTQVLAKNILSQFPPEWETFFGQLSNDELNDLPLCTVDTSKSPKSLLEFLNILDRLKPKNKTDIYDIGDYKVKHNSGLSEKKIHEILSLAPWIHKICETQRINIIVDVGAGLGYLSHLLNDKYHYSVLGIECSPERVSLAKQNQKKYFSDASDHVIFEEHFIDESSADFMKTALKKHFQNDSQSFCITGLHACADLSITILKLFMEIDYCKSLVIMPCCYHRFKLSSEDDKDRFENFPISSIFKDMFKKFEADLFLRRPFLRLACQENVGHFISKTEEEHEKHSKSFMYRAILEDVVLKEGWQVKRLKRKSLKSTDIDPDQDFSNYLENLKSTHKLTTSEGVEIVGDIYETFLMKMYEKWTQHKSDCKLLEVLTGLQASLQSVCENVVLLDRVEYLKENGFQCTVQKVTNDLLSPRCYAIVVVK